MKRKTKVFAHIRNKFYLKCSFMTSKAYEFFVAAKAKENRKLVDPSSN